MAERVWQSYYIPGGKAKRTAYRCPPMPEKDSSRALNELCIVSNFVEVHLAREGHDNPVGINYLEKIQYPHLASIYGAMLAGVGYVLMGAGIPIKIPGILDHFANHETAGYPLQVAGMDDAMMTFSPQDFMETPLPPLTRPRFLAIVASNTLAGALLKRANGKVDGFVIEGPTAGGHNAPPRGKPEFNDAGEPVYGERDQVDLEAIAKFGVPFWLAGGYGSPEKLAEALSAGAAGVQVGTAFAFCAESSLLAECKRALADLGFAGTAQVFTDPQSSPTGFPFKAAQLEGSASDSEVYAGRPRICDIGYLREAYRTADGAIGYRCSAEPIAAYIAKGGRAEKAVGKKCLCNALLANIGHPQIRNGAGIEPCLITCGDDLNEINRFLKSKGGSYSAADVVQVLMSSVKKMIA